MTAHRRRSGSRREVHDEQGRPIRERIRQRRRELDLTASELARRAGISPAYMTRIEKGEKVPAEKVALALARALDDDLELYLAWIHAGYFSDPESTLEGLQRVGYAGSPSPRSLQRMKREREERRIAELTEKRRRLERELAERADALLARPTSEDASEDTIDGAPAAPRRDARLDSPRSRMRRWAKTLGSRHSEVPSAPATLGPESVAEEVPFDAGAIDSTEPAGASLRPPVRLPVLAYGVDPGRLPDESEAVIDWLWLDPALLPGEPAHLFAYRAEGSDVDGGSAEEVRGALVVLSRKVAATPDPERFYAVRTPRSEERARQGVAGPVFLTRVRRKDDSLLVFPPGTSTDVEILELGDDGDLSRIVVGECLLVIRHAPGRRPA